VRIGYGHSGVGDDAKIIIDPRDIVLIGYMLRAIIVSLDTLPSAI